MARGPYPRRDRPSNGDWPRGRHEAAPPPPRAVRARVGPPSVADRVGERGDRAERRHRVPRAETDHDRPRLGTSSWNDSGNGEHVGQAALDRPRIIKELIDVVPRSGATLLVRPELVRTERSLELEFRYADRTILGPASPTGSHVRGLEPVGYFALERIVPAMRAR